MKMPKRGTLSMIWFLHTIYAIACDNLNGTNEIIYEDPDSVTENAQQDASDTSDTRCSHMIPDANVSTEQFDFRGLYRNSTGVLTSPKVYLWNVSHLWLICAEPEKYILIPAFRYYLGKDKGCIDEYLEICDGCYYKENGSYIEGKRYRYCGLGATVIFISSTGITTIVLKTGFKKQPNAQSHFYTRYEILDYYPECGGVFTTPNGTFTSPGYPNVRPNAFVCYWEVSVSAEKRIQFTVLDFTKGTFDNCPEELLMTDGVYLKHPQHKQFSTASPPQRIFKSNSNSVRFAFYPRVCKESQLGFKISWTAKTAGCNETINTSSGIITSPNYPNKWHIELFCWWQINVNPGYVIEFAIIDWAGIFSDSTACKIVDFGNQTDNFVGRCCYLMEFPSVVQTLTNSAMVRLNTISNHLVGIGFRLRFDAVCSPVVKGFRGIIESLNFPHSYPANTKCSWIINVGTKFSVVLNVTHFKFNRTNVWYRDSVEIYNVDEPGVSTKLVSKLTGKISLPYILHLHGPLVQVKFEGHFGGYYAGYGFRIEWKLKGCLKEVRQSRGVIQSPNYPQSCPQNTYCKWKIVTGLDTRIVLKINQWDIEKSNNCRLDGLKLYSGGDDDHPLLAEICGNGESPIVLTTNSNAMLIESYTRLYKFKDTVVASGFSAAFEEVSTVNGSTCGGIYTAPSGYITSSNFPKNYNNFEDCTWIIAVDTNYIAAISFLEVDLEPAPNCYYDTITVYDGDINSNISLVTICNATSRISDSARILVKSTGNILTVKFATNYVITRTGFRAHYTQKCGAMLRNKSRTIRNPDFVSIMNGAANCSWTIQAKDSDERVALIFTKFNWPVADPLCTYHNVRIYDGHKNKSGSVSTIFTGCCNHIPPPIVSAGDTLTLEILNADELRFQALYFVIRKDCLHVVELADDLSTISRGEGDLAGSLCTRVVTASTDNRVYVAVKPYQFNLHDRLCDTGFVQIYNNSFSETKMRHYCREQIYVHPSTDAYWVVYVRSREVNANFTLTSHQEILNLSLWNNESAVHVKVNHAKIKQKSCKLIALAITLLLIIFV